jgi:uncharacterized membrane protein
MSSGDNPGPPQPPEAVPKAPPQTLEEVLKEKAPDVLKDIPVSKRGALAQVKIERHEISLRAGPLPDPNELAAYNQVIENGADRILKMAEAQSAHRIRIESCVVQSQQRQAFIGQLSGLVIGISGLSLATYASVNGQPWFGAAIGGATLGSLVKAFLATRETQKRELSEKKQQMEQVLQQQNSSKKNRNR